MTIFCGIVINVIPHTLINTKRTRKHTLWIHMIGYLNTIHAHTHTHRHTKNESCSDEKAVLFRMNPLTHSSCPGAHSLLSGSDRFPFQ